MSWACREGEREGQLLRLAKEDKRHPRVEEAEQERPSQRQEMVRLHWDSEASKRRSRQWPTIDAK